MMSALPEIFFSKANDSASKRVLREAAAGRVRKLYAGIYTSNLTSPPEDIVRRNWLAIVGHLLPGGVVSHRSAVDGQPRDGQLVLTRGKTRRRVQLPGLTVDVIPGPGAIADGDSTDMPYGSLFLSSEARRHLENQTRGRGWTDKVLASAESDALLDRRLTLRGPHHLNLLRDAARALAPRLGLEKEYERLNGVVGALLGTHDTKRLHSRQALARAGGRPYDADRLPIFDALFATLNQTTFARLADPAPAGRTVENFAFFESYFSNYIEGTTFTVEEAEDIVFRGKLIDHRHEDSHDILGTFDAALRAPWRNAVPGSADAFLAQLQTLNELVMRSRPDKAPGQWKERRNQAGATFFVEPELVRGTLMEGFDRIRALTDPVARALLTMFVVTEVHPFADGNGRTSRLAMNAVLSAHQLCRIIVPTVYRDDYLLPLKALTHQNQTGAYLRTMARAQTWSAAFDYDVPRTDLHQAMKRCNAFQEDRDRYKLLLPAEVPTAAVAGMQPP